MKGFPSAPITISCIPTPVVAVVCKRICVLVAQVIVEHLEIKNGALPFVAYAMTGMPSGPMSIFIQFALPVVPVKLV